MNITILGAGSWATALAHVFSINSHSITLVGRDPMLFDVEKNINKGYFPDIILSSNIKYTTDLKSALKTAEMVLFCIPSEAFRLKAKEVAAMLDHEVYILNATKGLDSQTFKPLTTVLEEELPSSLVKGIISLVGPSFAEEVIHDKVTAICAVSKDERNAQIVQKAFSHATFRIYTNTDEIGCQIGAALKNVIAIASGAIAGLGEGENAKAALVTRGLQEIIRLGVHLGGKKETFYGLTGIGDLLLTCSSMKSRNFKLGYEIGVKDDASLVLKENKMTVEGVVTCRFASCLAKQHNINMPIVSGVYEVLFNNVKPSIITHSSMLRSLKHE